MIVKCAKTGKILASEEEIKEHAEAFGVPNFEEIMPDEVTLWMNSMTGKHCFTTSEMDVFCRRTGTDPSEFSEITVTEYLKRRAERQQSFKNDPRVEKFANENYLSALVDVRGFSVLQAEKALWFTRNESVAKAEEWLKENSKSPDFNVPLKLSEDALVPESLTAPAPVSVETIPMSEFINKDFLAELESMGFSSNRATRALWKTENAGVAQAIDWLTAHEADTDIDDPVPSEISVPKKTGPKLSKEEAQLAALELQRKLREERAVREAAEAREKERQRIMNTKAMADQQAVMEEQKRKREIMERERIKREEEAHKAELAEKLRLDFIERFGYEPPAGGVSTTQPTVKPKDRILQLLNQIKRSFEKEIVKNCLSTLRLYLANIESNSAEKKYHKIKTSNKIFVEKISPVDPAVELLKVCGFEPEGEFLEIKTSVADGYLCGQAVKYIDVILNQL
jgi:hypothetical protein